MSPRRAASQLGDVLKLSGDTFTIKDQLKQLGARFDGAQKCWFLPADPSHFKKLEFLGFVLPSSFPENQLNEASETQLVQSVGNKHESEETYTVSQFSSFVDSIFRKYLAFDLWIVGEVSSLKSSNGHLYFDLIEPEQERALQTGRAASFSCCFWSGKIKQIADKLNHFPFSDGIKIKLKVHCDFRKEGSRFSLIVDDLDPQFTLGDLALQRQNIVRELKRRGLYDQQRKFMRWGDFPLRIALLTASGSRAITDFMDELKISGISFQVSLFDCHMQGERVEGDITAALRAISDASASSFDCVVITRGGGSRLDLRWFDNLEICKAIAYCPVPVLTAIGHFEDVSVADEVALVAEKTPTGAARFLAQRVTQCYEGLLSRLERGAQTAQHKIQREKQWLEKMTLFLEQSVHRKLEREASRLDEALRALRLVQKTAAQPLRIGYALLRTPSGRPLKADDFLTSDFPTSVQLELLSRSKNAQVLIDLTVNKIRHSTSSQADDVSQIGINCPTPQGHE